MSAGRGAILPINGRRPWLSACPEIQPWPICRVEAELATMKGFRQQLSLLGEEAATIGL